MCSLPVEWRFKFDIVLRIPSQQTYDYKFSFSPKLSMSYYVNMRQFTLLSPVTGYVSTRLQALVYDILPSTTAVFSYAIGSRKLSASEQFFVVGVQTVVSLLQTTQIKQGVSFIAANKVYTSTNRTTIV